MNNSKGFVIVADGKKYVRQAYLCALSLIKSGNSYPVSLVTQNYVKKRYKKVFDQIIPIPWYEKTESRFKTENRWKVFHVTPYDETIVLDSDVLVQRNLNDFWELMKDYDLYYPRNVFTYRKEKIYDNKYRKVFLENDLINVYNAFNYFNKSDQSLEFYKWLELITQNWELFYGKFCKNQYPSEPSMDVTTAIAAKIMDNEGFITNKNQDAPGLVHMKPSIQKWKNAPVQWTDLVYPYISEDLILRVGNHIQDTVFHYTDDSFVTDEVIERYENA